MRRKLSAAAVSMLLGIVFIYYADGLWYMTAILCLSAIFAVSWRDEKQRRLYFRLLTAFCFGCVLMYFTQLQEETSVLNEFEGKESELSGVITEVQKIEEEKYRICCRVQGEKLLCSYYRPLKDHWKLTGCRISFRTVIEKPTEAGNPRVFDYRLYLKTKKIWHTAVLEEFSVISTQKSMIYRIVTDIIGSREEMMKEMNVSGDGAGLVKGVIFGDTKSLSEETYEAFRQNGTAHVLSVSGLHVGMLDSVYRKIYQKWRSLLLPVCFMVLLLLYGTVTLWSVPVTRAILLIVILFFADILQRRYDMVTALSAVAILAALQNPYVIFGTSFQMSFLAVLSMAFFTPPLEKLFGETAASMLSVQLGLLPYMAYTFNYGSVVGIVCNIPVVFLVSLLVPLGMAGYLFYFFSGSLLPFFGQTAGGLGMLTVKVNGFFQADGFLSFDVVSPPLWVLAAIYGIAFLCSSEYFLICFSRQDRSALTILLILIIAVTSAGYSAGKSPFDRADLIFLDVGQGDCLHVKASEGRNIFIDGGGSVRYNVGEKVLKPYLLKSGAGCLDLAAATHQHTDHYLGLQQLSRCFPVKAALLEGKAGQRIDLGKDQWIDILWPESRDLNTEDENLNSLIFKVYSEGTTALITGDITEEGEKMLIDKYKGTDALKADILKVAHHGSPYSTCDAFLQAVKPSVAVISVGKNNYGHPDEKLVEKIQSCGIMVYRTDRDGAVGIITERSGFSVCTKKQ